MGVSATLLTLALQLGAAPGIEVTDRVEYYRIEGATSRELAEQMRSLGPISLGRHANGLTEWEVEWSHASEMRDGTCRLTGLDVSITVVTTLPQWHPPHQAPVALVRQWQKFLAKLKQHEATHREHGLQAAAAVRQVIQAIPPQVDCHAMARAIASTGRKEIRRYAAESRRYDVLTNFGVKEGVRLQDPKRAFSSGAL